MKTLTIAFLLAVIGLLLMQTPEPTKKDFNRNCGCWYAFDSLQHYIDTTFGLTKELEEVKKDKK